MLVVRKDVIHVTFLWNGTECFVPVANYNYENLHALENTEKN